MKKALALTCAMTMAASLFLTGCGGSDYTTMSGNGSDNNSGSSNGSGKRVVNVCSWGEYIDEDLIYKVQDETGIKVNYQTAESNEALYSLLKTGAGDYDVIVPSDYMIARLIDEGMLAELNYDNIPNYEKIGEQYKSLSFDPENKYTVPYTWGTLGIIYNSTMVDGDIDSWDAMFDEKYAGTVLMIRNSRDAAVKEHGADIRASGTEFNVVRDGYDRLAPRLERIEYLGKAPLEFAVHALGRLVEQIDVRVCKQQFCHCCPLLLSAAQVIGMSVQQFGELREPRRLLEPLARKLLSQRIRRKERLRILRHIADGHA